MIGLDTNVLVRYLTQDDPIQSRKATKLIERDLNARNPGFVSVVAMVEASWVLDSAYGFSSTQIAAAIERILQIEVLEVENGQQVFTAMADLRGGRSSFADSLIGALGARVGCSKTVTFDHKAAQLPDFRLV
jgi:predicted nucleic-acid-binding protein